jgi:RHS repeat-associated protein
LVLTQLGTPRLVADENQKTVWRWDNQEPFGNDTPNEDPDGDGVAFDFPLRFPGQYFDRETNLAYNYFRDYSPETGRYVESDPIGLDGGFNTYAYVDADPLSYLDYLGLKLCPIVLPGLGNTYLDDSFIPAVKDFIRKNQAAGIEVTFSSAFRDSGKQGVLQSDPSATTPAPVGWSLHEAGLAVDVSMRRIPTNLQSRVVQNADASGMKWGGVLRSLTPYISTDNG